MYIYEMNDFCHDLDAVYSCRDNQLQAKQLNEVVAKINQSSIRDRVWEKIGRFDCRGALELVEDVFVQKSVIKMILQSKKKDGSFADWAHKELLWNKTNREAYRKEMLLRAVPASDGWKAIAGFSFLMGAANLGLLGGVFTAIGALALQKYVILRNFFNQDLTIRSC
jgi:hypothetical protein